MRVTAFDMLDQVHVAVVILEAADMPQAATRTVVTRVSTQRGTGESEPYQWARDALVQAVESL